jgi:hypothetical protein
LNNNKKWVEDYLCKNREETFKYNKEKAGINIKDQIFNIMCIKYDRSCDMVNYYLDYDEEKDRPKINAIKDEWINKFFGTTTTTRRLQNEKYKYGQKISEDLILYKADSNGNCIKADSYFLVPFESSCIPDDTTKNEIEGKIKDNDSKYNNIGTNTISEITNYITYDQDNSISVEKKILYRESSSNIIKFKVQWTKKKENEKATKNFPPGYLQGNPIKVSVKKGSDETTYNYGYYFHIYKFSNSNGLENVCVEDNDEDKQKSIDSIPILFKNNMFISCKYKNASPKDTVIYKIYTNLKNYDLKFYSAPNATVHITISDKTEANFEDALENKNIKMNLIFLTTQKGKENSPYDIIQKVYIKMEKEDSTEKKISLNVNFVDFSFSTIQNSKNYKITNSIPLPQDLLEKMSE